MKKNILGFYVSVNDVLIVHKLNCMTHLFDHFANFFLSETALFPERRVDISSTARLQNKIEMILITEESIELNNVRMVKEALNFNLSNELVYKSCLSLENFFRDFLEGADKINFFMTL